MERSSNPIIREIWRELKTLTVGIDKSRQA
jgi:hypothetical protein